MGMVRGTVVHEHVFKNPQVQFNARKFAWIGNMNADYDGGIVSAASGLKGLKDFYGPKEVASAIKTCMTSPPEINWLSAPSASSSFRLHWTGGLRRAGAVAPSFCRSSSGFSPSHR
jgi:hypothetical protein